MRRRTPVKKGSWGNLGRHRIGQRENALRRFESLEPRWLMDATGFSTCVASELGGAETADAEGEGTSPLVRFRLDTVDLAGNAISGARVGEQFRLRAFVDDLRSVPEGATPQGVFGAYVDVTFPSSLVTVATGATIQLAETLPSGSAAFTNGKSGTISTGLLDEVGAFQGLANSGLASQLLFSITMQATTVGSVVFATDAPDNQPFNEILLYGIDSAIPMDQVVFGSTSFLVLPSGPTADIVGRGLADGNLRVGESIGTGMVNSTWGQWPSIHDWTDVVVGDFDGDGKDDLAGRRNGNWWVSRTTESGVVVTESWGRWNPASEWIDVRVGDFDGDGQDDVSARVGKVVYVSRYDGSRFVTEPWTEWTTRNEYSDVVVADFDGDGTDELAGRIVATGEWLVGKWNEEKEVDETVTSTIWGKWNPANTWLNISVGDFNGDQRDDLAGRVAATGDWFVSLSDGTRFNTGSTRWGRWSSGSTWLDARVADVDGDGLEDLVGRVQSNGDWYVTRSTGSNLVPELKGNWSGSSWSNVTLADFTGDGRPDLAGRAANGAWTVSRWDSTNTRFVNESWGSWSSTESWLEVLSADLDGDGRRDMVGRNLGDWQWAKSSGTTFQNSVWHAWPYYIDWTDVRVADFDGDGFSDVIARNDDVWWVARSTQSGFVSQPLPSGRWTAAATWLNVLVGDFDGDGRDDVVGRVGKSVIVNLSTGSTFNTQLWTRWSTRNVWTEVSVGDFNNDGRDDLATRLESTGDWYVALSTGESFTDIVPWGKWNPAATWTNVSVGDFTGDGRDDIAGRVASTGEWWLLVSDGTKFISSPTRWTKWTPAQTWLDVRVADTDGDGRDDLLSRTQIDGKWYVSLSNGSAFSVTARGTWPVATWSNVAVADFTGDGRPDIIGRAADGSWTVSKWTSDGYVNETWGSWPTTVAWQDVLVGNFSNMAPTPLNLTAASMPESPLTASLSEKDLRLIVDAAIAQVVGAMPSMAAVLAAVNFQIADLPTGILGQAVGNTVLIDRDAAGFGWFADPTPVENDEFSESNGSGGFLAKPKSQAADQIDLLSVVLHELGHILGYEHSDSGAMVADIEPGVRYSWEQSSAGSTNLASLDTYFSRYEAKPSSRW